MRLDKADCKRMYLGHLNTGCTMPVDVTHNQGAVGCMDTDVQQHWSEMHAVPSL
jgi:hypothetical protein